MPRQKPTIRQRIRQRICEVLADGPRSAGMIKLIVASYGFSERSVYETLRVMRDEGVVVQVRRASRWRPSVYELR